MAPLLLSLGGKYSNRTEKSPLSAYWVRSYWVINHLKTINCNFLSAHFIASPEPTQPNTTTHGAVQAQSDKQSLPDKIRPYRFEVFHKSTGLVLHLTPKATTLKSRLSFAIFIGNRNTSVPQTMLTHNKMIFTNNKDVTLLFIHVNGSAASLAGHENRTLAFLTMYEQLLK
jgi:hypothetical protein